MNALAKIVSVLIHFHIVAHQCAFRHMKSPLDFPISQALGFHLRTERQETHHHSSKTLCAKETVVQISS